MIRRLAALLAAFGMTLMLAAPALAVDINQTLPIESGDADYQGTAAQCDPLNVQPGQVVWHFVLNQYDPADADQTLETTFETAGTITTSPDVSSNSAVLHYYVTTGSPDTLLSASTTGDVGMLLLSHICDGGPPPEIPEAPASVLLVLTAGLIGLGFAGWKMRRSSAAV